MLKLFKAMQYQYWWEKLLSYVNIYEPEGINPSIMIYSGVSFEVCAKPVSGPVVLKKFPISVDGFKTAIKWIELKQEIDNI